VNGVDEIFIKRGAETWSVFLSRPLRWEFAEAAAQRVIKSFSFESDRTDSTPVPPRPRVPKTAREFYERALERFNSGATKLAEADLDEAVRLDPNMADSYLLLARVYCSQKLIMSAIRMEDKAISLGGKVQQWCGRDRPPMK
jgi:hypothetical protein